MSGGTGSYFFGYGYGYDRLKLTTVDKYVIKITTSETEVYESATATATLTVTKGMITVPNAYLNLVYNGSEQVGIPDAAIGPEMYMLATNYKASNAGEYTAIVKIRQPDLYSWSDTSDTADKNVKWTIAQAATTINGEPCGKRYCL